MRLMAMPVRVETKVMDAIFPVPVMPLMQPQALFSRKTAVNQPNTQPFRPD
jgi:hypothetical protein